MSELTWMDPRCTREGWPSGPWDGEPDKVQWTDETGFVCLAKRHPELGHWCGYVGVPQDHPWRGKKRVDSDVHGGVNFGSECQEGPQEITVCHVGDEPLWWIGFHCGHMADGSPLMARLVPLDLLPPGEYRDLAYVRSECAKLAAEARIAVNPVQ